ncbi:hypothetical protein [Halegenticoccus tardaugens]|uniref:hypothetical protein n=1 Tax=Halegenticoccus tardaugens TaxID=2071624 RepID=UPI00100AA78B|nr:hypothetical protein [Halegenticoccus tardaugens]
MSIRMRGESGRSWIAASGVISLVLAIFLWTELPADALWVIGLLVGVNLLLTGVSMVGVALGARHGEKDATAPA